MKLDRKWLIGMFSLVVCSTQNLEVSLHCQRPNSWPELSISKLVTASKMQDVSAYALELMDSSGMVHHDQNPVLKNLFQNGYFFSAAMRIAGGTDEVLRNIIAERVLGLPQDERADKKVPFNELPSGKN